MNTFFCHPLYPISILVESFLFSLENSYIFWLVALLPILPPIQVYFSRNISLCDCGLLLLWFHLALYSPLLTVLSPYAPPWAHLASSHLKALTLTIPSPEKTLPQDKHLTFYLNSFGVLCSYFIRETFSDYLIHEGLQTMAHRPNLPAVCFWMACKLRIVTIFLNNQKKIESRIMVCEK